MTPSTGGKSGGARKTRILAWISFAFAIIGGAALQATFVGAGVEWSFLALPAWIGILALAGGLVAAAVDILVDGIPNRLAVAVAILIPSVAAGVHGEHGSTSGMAAAVKSTTSTVFGASTGQIAGMLGTRSAISIAIVACAVALLVSRRVMKKGSK